MDKWKLILGIALVLILGIIIGSAGTGYYLRRHFPDSASHHRSGKAFIIQMFSEELKLREDQKDRIGKIIDQIEEKRQGYHLEIKRLLDEIREGLDQDQQKRFDDLRERFKAQRKVRK